MPSEITNAPALADSTSTTIPASVVTPDQETQDFGGFINDFDKAGGKTEPLRTPASTEGAGKGTTPQQPATNATPIAPTAASPASPAAPTTPPAPAPLSQADLIRATVDATARALRPAPSAAPVAPPREITQQEFYAKYGIPEVTDATMQAILDSDPKKGAAVLKALIHQTTVAAVRMSNDLHEAGLGKVREEFAPDVQAWRAHQSEMKERAASDRFYTTYPALKAEAELVKEVLDATQAKVNRGDLKFTTEQEAFNFVAASAQKLVGRMTAQSSAAGQQVPASGASPTAVQAAAPHQRSMAAATSSARGGTGQKSSASELDTVMDAWG